MSMQDPIADMFSRIRNGLATSAERIVMPSSKIKISIAKLLKEEGYIKDFYLIDDASKKFLMLVPSYYQNRPVITFLERVSRPSLRVYASSVDLPSILGGLGVAIVSTSKGVMSDRVARALKQGGEVIGIVS